MDVRLTPDRKTFHSQPALKVMLFSPKLSVGNRVLDTEHKRLLTMTKEIACAITFGKEASLDEAFSHLEESLHNYFAIKEDIACAIRFDFTRQRQLQQNLLDSIQQIRKKFSDYASTLSERERILLASSLNDRLIHYFAIDCQPLKIVLDTHYYDFRPDNPALA